MSINYRKENYKNQRTEDYKDLEKTIVLLYLRSIILSYITPYILIEGINKNYSFKPLYTNGGRKRSFNPLNKLENAQLRS